MKTFLSRMMGGLVLLVLLAFGWASWRAYGEQAPIDAPTSVARRAVGAPEKVAAQQESPLPTATPTPIPTLAIWVTPQLPPIAWSAAPDCENHPQSVAAWQAQAQTESMTLSFQRLYNLSPALQRLGTAPELAARFLQDPGTDDALGLLQDRLGLWLNVINGQLNRATEIDIEALPDVKTVGLLIARAEQEGLDPATQKTVRQAIGAVLTGQAIVNPVCANRLIMQLHSEDLQSQVWSKRGVATRNLEVKKQIAADGWVPGLFQISPDYQKLAIESYAREWGGPIYIYDLQKHSLFNLNQALTAKQTSENAAIRAEHELWNVIGWHPDSQHLLLGNHDQSFVLWVDLQQMSFERIYFDTSFAIVNSHASYFDLLPDGSGFVYTAITYKELSEAGFVEPKTQIVLVDLNSKRATILWEDTEANTSFHYPRVSPLGTMIAFVVEQGKSAATMTYELRLFELETKAITTLVRSNHLGRSEFTWSPDGKKIAFTWSAPETQGFFPLFPQDEAWVGNLWVLAVAVQQPRQVTFVQAARGPVWSLDGKTLIFYTNKGQFGATRIDGDQNIWPLTEASDNSIQYGSLVEIP